MDELSDKISSLLNSPEGLEKVKAMASMLSAAGTSPAGDVSTGQEPEEAPQQSASVPAGGGSDAGSLLGGLVDPSLMFKLLPLIGQLNGPVNDPRINLLIALKPYVKGAGTGRINEAVQILKLSKVAGIVMKNFDIKLF